MILKINDRIRNRKVDYFNNINVSLHYDSVASTFSFDFYFNPDNPEHKELACIGHYHIATIEHNGELLLTGYVLSEAFNSSNVRKLVSFGGYSLPGVLEDCEIPPSSYPLQSDGLSLKEIAQKLIKPFKLGLRIDASVSGMAGSDFVQPKQKEPGLIEKAVKKAEDILLENLMNKPFNTSTAKQAQNIKSYLTELAAQKNIILSHDVYGNLLFTKAKTNQQPILHFEKGMIGTDMSLSFNGQSMHSDITVLKQADADGGNAGEHTIKNPYVPFVYRPKVVAQNSGDDNDSEQAAKNILAGELKNLQIIIVTDRWEINGKILKPNNIISILNPEIYIYKKTNFFIESIDYTGDNTKMTAKLTCVLPCVYDGTSPEYIFKGINLH